MSKLRVLHVEDEKNARLMLSDLLGDTVELVGVGTAEEGLEHCREAVFDLTLLDWMLPGLHGGEFLRAVREHGRAGRVVVVTAIGTVERTLEAMRAGAYDFLVKPVDPEALQQLVTKVARSVSLMRSAGRSRPTVERMPTTRILGQSHSVLSLKARLELVASSDASVLIVGESGTGKELVARALHEASGRHRARLVTVNCAAIPESLFESELFGHKRGAFTGATADRQGLAEFADGGTLFLDEVGELGPGPQAKLLRVLQDRTVRRVGADRDRPVDLRVIAATNRDLEVEVERGGFRRDLLYRLDVVRLEVPPLRERLTDLTELVNHFLEEHERAFGRPAVQLTENHLAALCAYPWPGNIRQLENTIKRAVLLGVDTALADLSPRSGGDLGAASPTPIVPAPAPAPGSSKPCSAEASEVLPLREAVRRASREAIIVALGATRGSRTEAAKLLKVSRKTLFNKMQELDIRQDTSWS
ncbi:sigma-54-dependent transcriptional regulator [Planctomycetota bacterium]